MRLPKSSQDTMGWAARVGAMVVGAVALAAYLSGSAPAAATAALSAVDAQVRKGAKPPTISLKTEEAAASITANTGGMPDIVHVVMDDIGMNDMWDSTDLPSSVMSNILSLKESGVELTNYYGQSFCTPARAALMSGKFSHRTGFGGADVHGAVTYEITAWSNFSLVNSVDTTFMSEALKTAGYENHGVGKWNLGHCNEALLPTARGFNTFLGYFGAGVAYETHMVEATGQAPNVFSENGVTYTLRDMVRCSSAGGTCRAAKDVAGTYTTKLFTEEAVTRIDGMANASSPTYVYVAHHGVHDDYGVNATQAEIPQDVMVDIRAAASLSRRRSFAVGMYFVDEGVGKIKAALDAASNDYVIVLHADNGGSPCGSHCDSNNYPYRGTKFFDFEGAVKLPSMIYSTRLAGRGGGSYNGLMHHVDWYATFIMGLAGATIDDPDMDSLDHWAGIKAGNYSDYQVRDTVAFSLGDTEATLRYEGFKYMKARSNSSWYPVDHEIVNEIFLCMQSGSNDFLFDLENDPYERHNLFYNPAYAETVAMMDSMYSSLYETQYVAHTRPVASPQDAAAKAAFIASTPAGEQVKYALPWGCDLS